MDTWKQVQVVGEDITMVMFVSLDIVLQAVSRTIRKEGHIADSLQCETRSKGCTFSFLSQQTDKVLPSV